MIGENKSAHLFGKFLLMLIFALLKRETVLDSVAQLVEQYTFNVWVLGSSPSGITKLRRKSGLFLCEDVKESPRSGKFKELAVLIACYYKQTKI